MEDNFQNLLNGLSAKPGRSRLEPYGELVDELQRRGFTCRDIAALLSEKFQFQISKSAVNNFVRARARKRRNAARQISGRLSIPTPIVFKPMTLHTEPRPSDDDVRQRIAALKARKPVVAPAVDGFYFDPTEPLRLIDPGKQDSND